MEPLKNFYRDPRPVKKTPKTAQGATGPGRR